MRRLRVIHVLCDLSGGGAERVVLDLCRGAGPSFASEVLTVQDGGPLAAEFARAGIRVRSAGRWRGGPGLLALGHLAGWMRGADIVHTHLWAGDTWGRVAARMAGAPVILSTEHNTRPDSGWRGRLTAVGARLAPTVVAVSGEAARALSKEGGWQRVEVIPNGVDLSRFSPTPLPGAPRVLGVGRLSPQKGFDLLVQAVLQLPGVALDLIGEGAERARLERLALPARDRIRLHGWQPDPRSWLDQAQIVCIPSRWEGFGLSAVEAMAAGRPVLATNVDALPTVLGPAGVLVPPEDPHALAEALRSLLADPARLSALAAAGPLQAARWSSGQMVSRYEALYLGLAAEAGLR